MKPLSFIKMHGLGNDFVILDGRKRSIVLSGDLIRALSDRRHGIGCDQLIVMEPPHQATATVSMRIYNRDGGEVFACGNATRCIASLLFSEQKREEVSIETMAGLMSAQRKGEAISIDMGRPRLAWQDIPLAEARDTLALDLGPLAPGLATAVSMGNPHVVFFVAEIVKGVIERLGPQFETHPLFPERANITLAQVLAPDRILIETWERGVGHTLACGTAACASLVAAVRRKLIGRRATLLLKGGQLEIEWSADEHIWMTGSANRVFAGTLDSAFTALSS